MHEWNNFYEATATAAATLTGLLFIGISINLSKILEYPALPTRAALSLILLMSVLLFSALLLIPNETIKFMGWLILVLGIIVWVMITLPDIKIYRLTNKEYKSRFLSSLLFDQLAALSYPIGGFCLLSGRDSGLYWIAAAFLMSFIKAVSDAWVLLIEILR